MIIIATKSPIYDHFSLSDTFIAINRLVTIKIITRFLHLSNDGAVYKINVIKPTWHWLQMVETDGASSLPSWITCFRRWWGPFLPWYLKTYHLLFIGMSNFDHHSYDHMIRSLYRLNLQFKTTLTMTSKYFLKAYHLTIRSSFHKGNALKWPIITKYQPRGHVCQ